jgi:hypothetical protein
MWNLIGVAFALATGAWAWSRSRAPGGFYAEGVYGMTPAMHRRYAVVSAAFALGIGLAWALHATFASFAALAIYAVIAILYYSSFIRGASDYHE